MVEITVNVPEIREFIKEIGEVRGRFFSLVRLNVRETVGNYLTLLMDAEWAFFLGRGRYERRGGGVNYRSGSYGRRFTIKGIGEVVVRVPRDRNGRFRTVVLPRG